MRAVFSAASDRIGLRLGIDAVLNELGNRFERITLRQRNNADRIPIIAESAVCRCPYC